MCSSLSEVIFVMCITMVVRAAPSVLKNFVNGIINTTNMISSSIPIAVSMFVLLSLFSFVIVAVRAVSGVTDRCRILNTFAPCMSAGLIV